MPRPPSEALALTDMVDRVPGLKKVDEAPPEVCADDGRDPVSEATLLEAALVVEASEASPPGRRSPARLLIFFKAPGMMR